MLRILSILILGLLIIGCSAQTTEPTPQQVEETEAPVPSDTSPPEDTSTPTGEPSPTLEPPTPTAEPSSTPTTESQVEDAWLAFTSPDNNLWIMNLSNGESLALTEDAVPFQPNTEQETISYCCAQWSSDGSLLTYRREVGTPATGGFEFSYSLWVYDRATGESRTVLEDQLVMGYAWKPGEHLIAYGLPIETEYFMGNRPELANGIWAVDVDSGKTSELVPPQRDITLVWPVWSPDGRFLSFDEILHMEGRGQFAYFDFEAQEYIAWDEVIGGYDWSPDGEIIAYDTLAYVAGGSERIWLRDRKGERTQPFSPVLDPGYASNPAFSPQGERIAYKAGMGGPETPQYTLMVQDIGSDEPRELGNFEQVSELFWSADGTRLIFTAGPYENREIVEVLIDDRSVTTLIEGSKPALQP